ncbi:hypothetical protein WME95_10590 [Sorangium sp. So ce327]|jgi:hypothetical protein|uniref:hypothetical protein n=1 Tax=Sorangium sp. So ce327 TaxID=3133301 RepID=UPI003F6317D6
MTKRLTDPFHVLPEAQRHELMRDTVMAIFGPAVGQGFWDQMEPLLTDTRRQPGDAEEPEKNFWRGRWRIYEAE